MDSSKQVLTGVKKRQQIHQANKAVFIWVAIAGVVVAVAAVVGQLMVKQFLFNAEVIGAKQQTNATLIKNAEQYNPLRTEVSKLVANQRLSGLRVAESDNALQVVIDAMPTVDDRLGLAASLQQSIFSKSGVRVEQLSFSDASVVTDPALGAPATGTEGLNEIPFSVKVVGTYDQLKKMFEDIQLSIRPVSITGVKLAGVSSLMTADITAKTYYAVPPTTDLKQKTVEP